MDSSKNLNLNLPGQTDFYNVNDFNENFNIIDEKIKELEDNSANVTPEEIGALSLENESLSNIDFLAWVKSQKTSKFFTVSSDCTNLPVTENFIGEIQAHHDGLWKKVLMLSIYGNGTPARMFTGVELNGNWSGWNEYLLTNGNVPMTGGLKVNGGHGTIGAIEQYTSISHIEEPGTNNYRNLTVTNQGETSEAVVLHEVRNGVETKTHKIYGEHYKPTSNDIGSVEANVSLLTGSIKDILNKPSKIYTVGENVTDMPYDASWWHVLVLTNSTSVFSILALNLFDNRLFTRHYHNNAWQDWIEYSPKSHSHTANAISAGTLQGKVLASNAATADPKYTQLRNIQALPTQSDLTAGTSSLTSGAIVLIYE